MARTLGLDLGSYSIKGVLLDGARTGAHATFAEVRRGEGDRMETLKAALTAKLQAGHVTVVDELRADEIKTKAAAALLKRLGATSRTLVVDVALDDKFAKSARNVAGVSLVASGRLTARDVMNTTRIIATRAALERLQEVLG